MEKIKVQVDFENIMGSVKPLHATNNGPVKGIGFGDQATRGFDLWANAGIPYVRTHDSSFCSSYGGEHTVDIHAIFPNFNADVNEPSSYDFVITDKYIKDIYSCGSKVFYRLGSKIEHEIKKYNTLPPKDYKKWAEICEHVIRHYTEGWANGFNYDLQYWEIWNEPDLDEEDATNKRTWGGTVEQFFRLYEVTSMHLKECFPHLKIGGPAMAFREEWFERFLTFLTKNGRRLPLDFLSWHCYSSTPDWIFQRGIHIRKQLDKYGYHETESILNEYNYLKSWNEFIYSVQQVISIKGAAFTAACMCGCQSIVSLDMLMYYDARPCRYNGLFDFYTNEPLKGYYPFKMFNELYELGTACECVVEGKKIYAAAAKGDDKQAVMISYFTDNDAWVEPCDIALDFRHSATKYEVFLLDHEKNAESVGCVKSGESLTVFPNTVCLLKTM